MTSEGNKTIDRESGSRTVRRYRRSPASGRANFRFAMDYLDASTSA